MNEHEFNPVDKAAFDAKAIAVYWSMVAFAFKNKKCSLKDINKVVDHIIDLQRDFLTYEAVHLEELNEELR